MSYVNNKLHAVNVLLTCAMCLLSCQPSGLIEADLTNLKSSEKRISADELYTTIKTIALEETEKSLLSYPTLIAIGDTDLIVADRNELLRFDREGKYKNNIGVF